MSRLVIYIQARMSSSRLPGKVLLPLFQSSLIETVVKRLSGNGNNLVRVLTSDQESDDLLSQMLEKKRVAVFRGSLTNVLERFYLAGLDDGLMDNDIVVRATADNPVPDAGLVHLVESAFLTYELDYIGADYPEDKLPYGLNVEVFRFASLREAHMQAITAYDREHVTPFIKRSVLKKAGLDVAVKHLLDEDLSNISFTIDTAKDYEFMNKLISSSKLSSKSHFSEFIEVARNCIV